jgi:hypothetical protein
MSRNMDDLIAGLRNTAEQLLVNCKARGYEMRPYFTLRTPEEQAKLWRQSRTGQEIEARIQDLEAKGAPYLARVIREAGPQNGAKVTHSAQDRRAQRLCYLRRGGRAAWIDGGRSLAKLQGLAARTTARGFEPGQAVQSG